MAIDLTPRAERALKKSKIEPQLVLEIDGISTLFGAVLISRAIRIGDPNLYVGNAWSIGGVTPLTGLLAVEDQADAISFEGGTSTEITQQIQPDRGTGSSISSVSVALTDRRNLLSRIISPNVVIDEILGTKATLWMGLKETAFKTDYIKVFSGIIDDVVSGAGLVTLNIAHPEQLKRQNIFIPVDVEIDGSITNIQTTIPLVSAANLLQPVNGPDGTEDDAIKFYIQVEDEIIRYTGISGNTLTGCTRGELATLDVAHTEDAEGVIAAKSLVSLEDISMYAGLKFMLSGVNGPWVEDIEISQFLHPDPDTTVANSIFFADIDLNQEYGLVPGDFVTITGASHGANNCTAKTVEDIVVTSFGSYAVISGVSFIEEDDTAAVVAFRSQFDTLGEGLGMTPDQVDVAEHIYWSDFLLAAYTYRFIFTEAVDGKEFLDREIYLPVGAYSLPRKGRASMGYHVGPSPRGDLLVLNRENIKNPDRLKLRRTINRNFYNTIVYKYDKNPISGKFNSGLVEYSATSRNRIRVGTRDLSIESAGMRRTLGGASLAERGAERYLARYSLAAEFFEDVGVLFRDGATVEPGDQVVLDLEGLNVTNTADGTRVKPAKIFSVMNTKINLKTGDVRLALTDTNFDGAERYASISPSSLIVSGTTTSLIIEDSFGAIFPGNESRKWEDYVGLPIIIHSEDWSFAEQVTLLEIDAANKYKLNLDPSTPLSEAPEAGYVVDIGVYPLTDTDPNTNAVLKAAHAYLGATVAVTGGSSSTVFAVGAGDVAKFQVGATLQVRNLDFSDDSGDVIIESVVGTTITVTSSLGFTPTTSHFVEALGFADGGKSYRVF